MEDFIIATASTCDADREWLEENNIPMLSYTFEVNEKVYIDDCRAETKHALFHEMREGHQPKTSQITAYAYYEFFKELLEKNKNILFLDMDKALSSSYFNSQRAYEDIQEEFPDNNLVIVDTRCVTMGLSFLLKKAVALKNEGKSILMISEELPELIGMSDRVLIMKDGEITMEFERSENLSDSQIIEYMI